MVKSGPTLAQRLTQARAAIGMSQEQIAQAVGITQPSYSALERGVSKSTSKIGSLAHVLGVDAYWLETGEGQQPRRGHVAESRADYRLAGEQRRLLKLLGRLSPRKRQALLDLLQE
ncbi:helix-turn-helix domain-containing protein [Pseudoxanthomonas japonensis]|nr:helix-turn-helix domain-containing protein [Pseudoxanthomonas japonensis]